jgi:hypothetical protein
MLGNQYGFSLQHATAASVTSSKVFSTSNNQTEGKQSFTECSEDQKLLNIENAEVI